MRYLFMWLLGIVACAKPIQPFYEVKGEVYGSDHRGCWIRSTQMHPFLVQQTKSRGGRLVVKCPKIALADFPYPVEWYCTLKYSVWQEYYLSCREEGVSDEPDGHEYAR